MVQNNLKMEWTLRTYQQAENISLLSMVFDHIIQIATCLFIILHHPSLTCLFMLMI